VSLTPTQTWRIARDAVDRIERRLDQRDESFAKISERLDEIAN
jgi:hypothetical protein